MKIILQLFFIVFMLCVLLGLFLIITRKDTNHMKKMIQSLFIVSIFCILFGFSLTTIGFASGGKHTIYYTKSGLSLINDLEQNMTETEYENKQELSEFSDISIDVRNFDIKLSEGDSYSIKLGGYFKEQYKPEYKIQNGTLTISQSQESIENENIKAISALGDGTIFGINYYNSMDFQDKNNYIFITYPKDKSFNKIQLTSTNGETDLDSLQAKEITINQNYGAISFKNCNFEKLNYTAQDIFTKMDNLSTEECKISQRYGEIELYNSSFQELDLDTADSDLEMENINSSADKKEDSSMTLEQSYGEISLKNVSFDELDFTINNASIDMEEITADSLKHEQQYGNINLKNVFLNSYEQEGNDTFLEISKSGIGNLNTSMQYGEISVKKSDIPLLTIEGHDTEVSILENTIQNADIQNRYGDITFVTNEEQNAFNYDLETEEGEIYINDETFENTYTKNNSSEKILKISTDRDITIKTK